MIIALLFILVNMVLFVAMFARCRRSDSLARGEAAAAAFTFLITIWTALAFAAGFRGHFTLASLFLTVPVAITAVFVARNDLKAGRWKLFGSAEAKEFASGLDAFAWIFAAMGLSGALYFLQLGVRMPVTDFDGLSYHLGLAVHMFQDGDFRHYPYESIMTSHFSRGVELLMAMTMMLAGNTIFVNCVQWLILPVMSVSVYTASRALGADRSSSVVASMIPLTVPVVLFQSSMAYADLFSGGWFVVGFCTVLGAADKGRVSAIRVVWMFAAAGLALAAKANAGILAVLMGIAAMIAWGPRSMFGSPKKIGVAALGFAVSAAVGLPWLLHNWMTFGSPLYPFGIRAAGIDFARGPLPFAAIRDMAEGPFAARPLLDKIWQSWSAIDFASWKMFGAFGSKLKNATTAQLYDSSFGYSGDAKFGGFGSLWLVGTLPAMLVAFALAWKRDPRVRRYSVIALSFPLLAFFVLVAPWWSRFTLFLPVLGAVAVALILARVRPNRAAYTIVAGWLVLLATFDWTTCIFINRDTERMRRYHQQAPNAGDTPIHYFQTVDPSNPAHKAVRFVVDHARPGETVSFRTPHEPLFTGYFADEKGSVRLFPLPSFWPPEGTYTEKDLAEALEAEKARYVMVSSAASAEFRSLIEANGAMVVYTTPGYEVYEFTKRKSGAR